VVLLIASLEQIGPAAQIGQRRQAVGADAVPNRPLRQGTPRWSFDDH